MCNCLQNCFENGFKIEVEKFTHTYILYRQIHKVMPQDHLSAIRSTKPCILTALRIQKDPTQIPVSSK